MTYAPRPENRFRLSLLTPVAFLRRMREFLINSGYRLPLGDGAFLLAAAALGAGLVLLRQASYGPEMTWDSVNYVTVARNLLAGDGFFGLFQPLTLWPPLYPALLAGGGLFGLDPYAVAGPLNAAIFGLTVLVAGWWLRRYLHSKWLWQWGCLAVALALPLVEIATQAMSEAAFILFVTLSLTQIDAHLNGGGRASLLRAAAFSALAGLTRYLGPALILAVVPLLLAAPVAPREKLKRIAVYTLLAAAPLGLWLLRNFLLVGSATGSKNQISYSFPFILDAAWRIAVAEWWLIGLTAPVLVALGIAAGYAFRRYADRKRAAPVAYAVALRPLSVLVGFALAYLALLAAAMMLGGTWSGLQWRFLVPVYIPLLFAALLLLDAALRYARQRAPGGVTPRRRRAKVGGGGRILAVVLTLTLALQTAWLVRLHLAELPEWNAGHRQQYAAPWWRDTESAQYLSEAGLTGATLSNSPAFTGLYADGPTRHYFLPCGLERLRPELSEAAESGGGAVHVIHYSEGWRRNACSPEQAAAIKNALAQEPLLELVAELENGQVYRLR